MFEKLIQEKQKVDIMYAKGTDYDFFIGIITEFDSTSGLIRITCKDQEYILPLASIRRIRIITN
ncbi:hypothetical protein LSG31_18195 [Fodinisporobacter ferrooxydans]|uniref:DUF2642 domain-containing protein n=1 Tax=Fodinisporobacter ferrooxydans TaxID=2901836 RepID=A0ABY4CHF1_9BACL|nr:hypothetical protein LSG31_18195 [Alicyclobacillaceae bacterium MYW30-H2]